jgi:hypothetical protein
MPKHNVSDPITHRAAVQQQLVEQDSEEMHRLNLGREQVLARLWEIANLSPEMTRGSIAGQVKALSMIVAMEGLIPDRRAPSAQNKSAPPPVNAQIYRAAWLAKQQSKTADPQPGPALAQEEDEPGLAEPPSHSAEDAPTPPGPTFDPSDSAFAHPFHPSETTPSALHAPAFAAPDTRVPFSIKKNPFARRR